MHNSVVTTLFTENNGEIDTRINAAHSTTVVDFASAGEQQQVSDFIKAYRGGKWDL
jgi:hypothetical protein